MSFRFVVAASLIAVSAPAFGQSLHETHVKVPMPAGKTSAPLFRPLNRDDCSTAQRHHQAGKMAYAAVAQSDACAEIAAKRAAARVASAD